MRKEIDVTIAEDGRDKGKIFTLREMPASQAERWGTRAILALSRGSVDVPPEVLDAGFAGFVVFGLRMLSSLPFAEAQALADELMTCVRIRPDPAQPNIVRNLIEEDIEEVITRVTLKEEVFKLHENFSIPAALSKLILGKRWAELKNTLTSRGISVPSSGPA